MDDGLPRHLLDEAVHAPPKAVGALALRCAVLGGTVALTLLVGRKLGHGDVVAAARVVFDPLRSGSLNARSHAGTLER